MSLAAALLLAGATAPAQVAPIDVQHYRVRLQPDLAAGTLRGEEDVRLCLLGDGDTVSLDAGALVIDSASLGKQALTTLARWQDAGDHAPPRLSRRRVPDLAAALQRQGFVRTAVACGAPTGVYDLLYQPMDAGQRRALGQYPTLDLDVVLPRDLQAIGTGIVLPSRYAKALTTHRWRLRQAMPSYLYGFAAGSSPSATLMRTASRSN